MDPSSADKPEHPQGFKGPDDLAETGPRSRHPRAPAGRYEDGTAASPAQAHRSAHHFRIWPSVTNLVQQAWQVTVPALCRSCCLILCHAG
jgi:hypothetical protein